MTDHRLLIDGTEVPVEQLTFDTPKTVHELLQPPGRPNARRILGVSGFGMSFAGRADDLRPILDGERHDVLIRSAAGPELPVKGVRLEKHDEDGGTWYGHGRLTSDYTLEWRQTNG